MNSPTPSRRFARGKRSPTVRQSAQNDYVTRLSRRKLLLKRRKVICDCALGFASLGIVITVTDSELFLKQVYRDDDLLSIVVKVTVSLTTVVLFLLMISFHVQEIKLFMCNNMVTDWRLAMSAQRICTIAFELVSYSIHPFPGVTNLYDLQRTHSNGFIAKTTHKYVLFVLPMLCRLMLVGRIFVLHSRLFTNTFSKSIGALNCTHFNFTFIFKSMMTLYPMCILITLIVVVLLIASWFMRACEMPTGDEDLDFVNSLWLVTITFLAVGYGDFVPISKCGRSVAVLSGMFGAGCTALGVAILARKLEMSRSEKCVQNFVIDIQLHKENRVHASNIIKAAWLAYRHRRHGNGLKQHYNEHKLLASIEHLRKVRIRQQRLANSSLTVVDIYNSQSALHSMMTKFQQNQSSMSMKIKQLDTVLGGIDSKLNNIHKLLSG